MRVDRESLRPEGAIHHDIGGLAPDARKLDERVAVGGDFAAEVADENFAQRDDILRLRIEQPDRLICCLRPSSPRSTICCGVFTSSNSRRFALFTPTSVACAESTTATSN